MWFSAVPEQENALDGRGTRSATSERGRAAPSPLDSAAAGTEPSPSPPPAASALPPVHYVSRRSPVYCRRGCVATSQPLATSIGLHVLRGCGGNAADASVAVAAALAVVSVSK